MKLSYATIALGVTLGACAALDFTEAPLRGTWGGAGGLVVAGSNQVVMQLGCDAVIRISGGIFLNRAGMFVVDDSLRGNLGGGMKDTLPEHPVVAVRIAGSVVGDRMTFSLRALAISADTNALQVTYGNSAPNFDGREGKPADGVVCRQ